jgi:hypothetical protein
MRTHTHTAAICREAFTKHTEPMKKWREQMDKISAPAARSANFFFALSERISHPFENQRACGVPSTRLFFVALAGAGSRNCYFRLGMKQGPVT